VVTKGQAQGDPEDRKSAQSQVKCLASSRQCAFPAASLNMSVFLVTDISLCTPDVLASWCPSGIWANSAHWRTYLGNGIQEVAEVAARPID
jgi:hypothetical protein